MNTFAPPGPVVRQRRPSNGPPELASGVLETLAGGRRGSAWLARASNEKASPRLYKKYLFATVGAPPPHTSSPPAPTFGARSHSIRLKKCAGP